MAIGHLNDLVAALAAASLASGLLKGPNGCLLTNISERSRHCGVLEARNEYMRLDKRPSTDSFASSPGAACSGGDSESEVTRSRTRPATLDAVSVWGNLATSKSVRTVWR